MSQTTPRCLSPTSQASGGLLKMLATQIRTEFLSNWRVPEFLIGVAAIPVMLFMMFGLPNARVTFPDGTTVGALMMASFSAYGLLSLVIFSFGVDIANERGRGWLRLVRATPMPGWTYFVGKLAMSLLFASLILLVLFAAAALFAGVRLPPMRWLATFGTLLVGGLSLSTLGFALGYLARPRAASTLGNLIYLPLSFASGFFFPLGQLPEFLRTLAPYLPTYHYGRLVWGAVGSPEAVGLFTGLAPTEPWLHTLWLAGSFVVFGALALWGYRRDQGQEGV
ncbi:MAG: ABC transporter permease [Truepera sp.]|nr:ABC transporter permease [Truepera sp.]